MPLGETLPSLNPDRRRGSRLALGLLLANALVGGLLVLLVAFVLNTSHRAYEQRSRDQAESLVAIAQANIGSELSRVDSLMLSALHELEAIRPDDPRRDEAINRSLDAHRSLLAGVEGLRMADAQGRVRWGNGVPPGAAIDVSDRDYFIRARAHPDAGLVVEAPIESRLSGRWVMALVRPIVSPGGRFEGIVYASMGLDHFQSLFARYDLETQDAMTLRTTDLKLIARHAPGSSAPITVGNVTVSAELRAAMARNPMRGVFTTPTALDGVVRTTAYRRVEGWPFVVFSGLGIERFYAPWRTQAVQVSVLAGVAWLLIAAASGVLFRAWRRESASLRALSAQTRRTQSLLRVAADGIHIMNREGRLIGLSDSFAEMLGSTREQLLGRHISSWDANQDEARVNAWLAKVRDGDRQRIEVQHKRDDGRIIDVELQVSVADIEGERLIFGSARDVTERRRLQREQAAMLDNEIVGMTKLRSRVIMWKNRALERMFGYAPGELDGQSTRILYLDQAAFEAVGAQAYPLLARGETYRTQVQMRHKEGHLLWVDLNSVSLTGGESLWMMVDITAMMEAQARVEHIAFHDALTQLPNRLLLTDRMRQAIHAAQRANTVVAVCYLDLDGFKQVNDTHGHDAGDALLVELARRLQSMLRGNDSAARLGGDEFVVLLTMLGRSDDWRHILQRLTNALHAPVTLPDGTVVSVGTSVGVALAPQDGTDPALLLTQADQAMLRAKRAGKGRVEPASQSLTAAAARYAP